MINFYKILFVVLVTISGLQASIHIIPSPVELKIIEGEYQLKKRASISYANDEAKQVALICREQLSAATGYKLKVKSGTKGHIVFDIIEDNTLGKEGYLLIVDKKIKISAQTSKGLFYGLQTLRQLLPPAIYSKEKVKTDWNLPKVEIRDYPRFGWRGMHLDVARYFMPKKDIFKFIDNLASLKFNVMHWHLTEDQGWRIEIKKYPKLTEVGAWRDQTVIGKNSGKFDGVKHGGFYTQDDIREIVAYAEARSITIVPEIDMPGHMQAAIASYPELGSTDKKLKVMTTWGVSKNILNPEDSTIEFCKNVLTEVMALFPSEFIHIGGDEAPKDQWEKSPRIQSLMKERGLKNMHEMQSWFIKQMDDFLVANGRRLIGWDEIAEGGLAKNAAVMWWRGGRGLGIAKHAAEKGHDIVVAATSHLYFDYYQSQEREKEPFAIGGFLPLKKVYNFEPIIAGLSPVAVNRVLGAQGQLWTEYMRNMKEVEYMAFPRACALSEVVWTPAKQKDYQSFFQRMLIQQKRFDITKTKYRALD